MKKILVSIIFSLFICTNAFAYQASMCHWANVRDNEYNLIASVDEGEVVEVVGICLSYPERTEIIYNNTFGSVLTECITDLYVDECNYDYNFEQTCTNNIDSEYAEYEEDDCCFAKEIEEYAPTGIFSKVTANLALRDRYNNVIGCVPCGASVEVLQLSQEYSGRMVVNYGGLIGTVLAGCIEQTCTNNIDSEYSEFDEDDCYFAEEIEEYASTGIFSKVTANLTLRDRYNNVIGCVPCGAFVEVLQLSQEYSGRMVVNYGGLIGTVLAECIEHTYADNIDSEYDEYEEDDCYFAEKIEENASTGIFSKVTANLTLRDQCYNVIGCVPCGATVKVLQLSHEYSGRLVVNYDGLTGTVLAGYIEPYADNVCSKCIE